MVQPAKGAAAAALTPGINYPASLVTHVAELTGDTQIVQDQLADKTTDVFTGSTFGKTQENSFDMESLFTVDADAIKNAIRFDESVMTGGLSGGMDVSDAFSMDPSVLDFGSMDLSGISIDLPQNGMNLDLSELLSGPGAFGFRGWLKIHGVQPAGRDTMPMQRPIRRQTIPGLWISS